MIPYKLDRLYVRNARLIDLPRLLQEVEEDEAVLLQVDPQGHKT
jgi:hypothetical protein